MSIICGSGSQEEEEDEPNPHHFALNFDYYTHFTSPIRRYPDVMVHRVLHCLLENQLKPRENEAVAADDDEEEVPTGPCYFQTRDLGFKRLKPWVFDSMFETMAENVSGKREKNHLPSIEVHQFGDVSKFQKV